MKRLHSLMIFAALLPAVALADDAVSFSRQIAPVLKSRCVSCHLTGTEAGKLALPPKTAYSSIVGVKADQADLKLVEPGKPDDSYLLLKIEGKHLDRGGQGGRMPFGSAPLDDATVQLIRDWITAGAPHN